MRWVAVLVLVLLTLAVPAVADTAVLGCTNTARVRWDVDLESVRVDAAVVEVPGCPDGEIVGLQLITDNGDIPAEALAEPVVDEQATFDLTPYALRVEPVTGVRVFLYGEAGEDAIEIIVDRRFFNRPGNEQVGLREMTLLQVEPGQDYEVAGAPDRYRTVACSEVGLTGEGDVVGEGVGTFSATASGRHIVCHLMRPVSGRGNGPDDQTDVLGDSVTKGGGTGSGGVAGGSSPLPGTGRGVLPLAAVGLGGVVAGALLLLLDNTRRRRALSTRRG